MQKVETGLSSKLKKQLGDLPLLNNGIQSFRGSFVIFTNSKDKSQIVIRSCGSHDSIVAKFREEVSSYDCNEDIRELARGVGIMCFTKNTINLSFHPSFIATPDLKEFEESVQDFLVRASRQCQALNSTATYITIINLESPQIGHQTQTKLSTIKLPLVKVASIEDAQIQQPLMPALMSGVKVVLIKYEDKYFLRSAIMHNTAVSNFNSELLQYGMSPADILSHRRDGLLGFAGSMFLQATKQADRDASPLILTIKPETIVAAQILSPSHQDLQENVLSTFVDLTVRLLKQAGIKSIKPIVDDQGCELIQI